ncbi:hypothetical protein [Megalodesulfovibrio paquesii]
MNILSRILACLVSGAVGGLVNSVAVWGFGILGINQALDFAMAPALTWPWLGPRLLFGGLWGLLLLLPFWKSRPWPKALVISLAPTAYMLFKVFPDMGKGLFGLGAGAGAPYMVLFFNAIWGLSAMGFLIASQVGGGRPAAPRKITRK